MDQILPLLFATLYAWLDFSVSIVYQSLCKNSYPTRDKFFKTNGTDAAGLQIQLFFYGTGSTLVTIELCKDIPRYICMAYICVKLPVYLIRKIRLFYKNKHSLSSLFHSSDKMTREEKQLISYMKYSVEALYVRNLFIPAKYRPSSRALLSRIVPTKIYEFRDDFRFSTRIICLYSSVLMFLFVISIDLIVTYLPVLEQIRATIKEWFDFIFLKNAFPVPNLTAPFICAVLLAAAAICLQLAIQLVIIRRNLLQVYRGDDTEVPHRKTLQNVSTSTGNVHFAGISFNEK
ncbi:unnamed protein product [Didymodactylos carnosus]|uniref:Uncharacterized protein n=1 Tax=Didymodactylos carnosus TaxID=1234261 RepID=A0A814M3J5_9BILA|nr:unnamed protein product [Didymodactylos carnosus]CAF1131375.1 unnamed protein product [Didymodactylos carnosus]CAF3839734.1 unnamed protein product [Didymodactylos carnosus]CAF3915150.1 unnamed protein product [Didymodactylos carnosus]